jgi:hypothetical protein
MNIMIQSRVLQDVLLMNNNCIHQIEQQNDTNNLLGALHVLQCALRMLRNEAAEITKMERVSSVTNSSSPPSPSSFFHPYQPESSLQVGARLHLLLPRSSVASTSIQSEIFYVYDRPLLLQVTNTDSDDGMKDDKGIMSFTGATLLFNFAVVCHRYGRTQLGDNRATLLLHAARLYSVLIELLNDIIVTKVSSNEITETNDELPESNDDKAVCHTCSIVLLLTLTYSNLGLIYFELNRYAECHECMITLNELLLDQNEFYELLKFSYFDPLICEVKMNVKFWRLYVPSSVAVAA